MVAVAGVLALDDDRRLLLVRRRSDGSWTHPAGRGTVVTLGHHSTHEISEIGWFSRSALPVDVFAPARPIIEDAFTHEESVIR